MTSKDNLAKAGLSIMATGVNGSIQIKSGYANSLLSDGTVRSTIDSFAYNYSCVFAPGITAGLANKAYADHQMALATSANITYILSSLPNGQVMTAVRKLLLVVVSPVGSGVSATIAPASVHGWTNGVQGSRVVGPGGVFSFAEPDVTAPLVVSGGNDSITITAVMGPIEYYLELVGIG